MYLSGDDDAFSLKGAVRLEVQGLQVGKQPPERLGVRPKGVVAEFVNQGVHQLPVGPQIAQVVGPQPHENARAPVFVVAQRA